MITVTCPACRGAMTTDGPQAVTCPHCGQVVTPVASAARAAVRPAAPPQPVRRPRPADDEGEGDRPSRRRRNEDDEDEEEDEAPRPRKKPRKGKGKRTGPPVGLLAGGAVGGLLLLLVCGGLGVYFLGDGRILSAPKEITVLRASRDRVLTTMVISYAFRVDRPLRQDWRYRLVAKGGGRTAEVWIIMSGSPNDERFGTYDCPALLGVPGPCEFWIERRPPGGGDGVVISNVVTFP